LHTRIKKVFDIYDNQGNPAILSDVAVSNGNNIAQDSRRNTSIL
jgi:hypothetical protein